MNALKYISILNLLIISLLAFSCQDVIDYQLPSATPQLTVDAWLTTKAGAQTIRLTLSADYFKNASTPAALGANVQVVDNEGLTYTFTDADADGNYVWTPQSGESFGKLGNTYTLTVTYQGETYQAESEIRRVPAVDSIVYEKRKEFGNPEGIYTEVYARDFAGSGDCYWLRGFKNGRFLNRVGNLTTAYDAGFSAGGNTDGINFIRPIREGINELLPDANNNTSFTTPPFKPNDEVKVELYSITLEAFDFWVQVREQLQNGGLFAIPLANVNTNLVNQNANSKQKAIGFFCTSAVTSLQGKIEDKDKGVIK
jgi:hypothetical protein